MLAPLGVAWAQVGLYPDEIERLDVISIEEDGRDLVAINAVGDSRPRVRLEVDEPVVFRECSGRICVVLTDRRALGVSVSGIFQEARFRIAERAPDRALVSQRLALVATPHRLLGFVAEHGRWVEEGLTPGESIEAVRIGAAVAAAATNRRALGLAPNTARFASLPLQLKESLESFAADDTLATLRTDRRSLVFSGPRGTWTARRRDGS
ncbi:MAG: hypothetical protein R3F35_09380 [Myxococcota bacterium]